jgi:diadenosine tetraphosphatase ApaH/serine/threonine PP2A family protein phosphatase
MKIGIFSDVHANLEALDSALAFCRGEGVSEYFCLGDTVGYGADPNECISRIRELRVAIVAGNHDYGVIRRAPFESFNELAQEALIWTRQRLSAESRDFLESLEPVEVRQSFRLVHAGPSAPLDWEYIRTWPDIAQEFNAFSEPVCLVGHTHIPYAARKHPSKDLPQRILESEFEIHGNAVKLLINAGSVGQSRDGDPRLCLMIFDTRTRLIQVHRLSYDVVAAQRKIVNAGLPDALALRLGQGR